MSARWWLVAEGSTTGVLVTWDVSWWVVVPLLVAHAVLVVGYGEACVDEAVERAKSTLGGAG